jgi:hypothetical protein
VVNDDQSDGQSTQALYFGPEPTLLIDCHLISPKISAGLDQQASPRHDLHKDTKQ